MQNNTYSRCDLILPFGLAESDLHFIAMPTSSRKIVINKGYVGDDSATNETTPGKAIEREIFAIVLFCVFTFHRRHYSEFAVAVGEFR